MEISIENILSVFEKKSDKKKMSEIKKAVILMLTPDDQIFVDDQVDIEKQIESVIKQDQKLGDESRLIRTDGKYKQRPNVTPPPPGLSIDSLFVGAAGETAVISELLFREYNANRMMVDKGIDIVATKDNVYRYIQVKTSFVKEKGNIYWQVKQEVFDAHVINNLRYATTSESCDNSSEMVDNTARILACPSLLNMALIIDTIRSAPIRTATDSRRIAHFRILSGSIIEVILSAMIVLTTILQFL